MSKFDWSTVTIEQLRDVPQAVVGDDFELDTDDRPFYLQYKGQTLSELWSGEEMWFFTESAGEGYTVRENTMRAALACIDRIANYLRMRGTQ